MIQHYKDGLHFLLSSQLCRLVYRRWKVSGYERICKFIFCKTHVGFPGYEWIRFVLCTLFQVQSQILSIYLQIYYCLAGSPGFLKNAKILIHHLLKIFFLTRWAICATVVMQWSRAVGIKSGNAAIPACFRIMKSTYNFAPTWNFQYINPPV